MNIPGKARAAAVAAAAAALTYGSIAWAQSDAQVRQALIRDSIAGYSGSCPCPYSTDRAGRRCGARSAYSRPGGAAPLCYPDDVTPEMIRSARSR